MKQTVMLLLILSISTFSLAQPNPVIDTDGDVLETGVEYYILPVLRDQGGGVTLASTRNTTCPLDVVQEPSELENGLPLTFTPVDPSNRVINESADINIKFSASSICVQSTVWTREEYDGEIIVTTGGVEGDYGPDTLNNWFKIDKLGNDYKIAFCPQICVPVGGESCALPLCGDIGISVNNGARRLVFSDVPLQVKFMKA